MIMKGDKAKKSKVEGQCSLFTAEQFKVPLPDTAPFEREYELEKEASVLGMFVSEHPAELYEKNARFLKHYTAIRDISGPTGRNAVIHTMGLVSNIESFMTKKGERMATFNLGTKYHSISCIIFPDAYRTCKDILVENRVSWASGQVAIDRKDESKLQLFVSQMRPIEDILDKSPSIVVEVQNLMEQTAVLNYAKNHPGNIQVVLKAHGMYFPTHAKVSGDRENDMKIQFKVCA